MVLPICCRLLFCKRGFKSLGIGGWPVIEARKNRHRNSTLPLLPTQSFLLCHKELQSLKYYHVVENRGTCNFHHTVLIVYVQLISNVTDCRNCTSFCSTAIIQLCPARMSSRAAIALYWSPSFSLRFLRTQASAEDQHMHIIFQVIVHRPQTHARQALPYVAPTSTSLSARPRTRGKKTRSSAKVHTNLHRLAMWHMA